MNLVSKLEGLSANGNEDIVKSLFLPCIVTQPCLNYTERNVMSRIANEQLEQQSDGTNNFKGKTVLEITKY